MSFFKLILTANRLKKLRNELEEEKLDSIKVSRKEKPKKRLRHIGVDVRIFFRKILRKILDCFCLHKFCFKLKRYGSLENYLLKSIVGYASGFLLTFVFFIIFTFQLNFSLETATIFCCVLGIVLMIGLAFSVRVRCIVLLTLPQFFSQKGRQALLAYAFMLTISGPAKNILDNMGIMSESLACGQEQLKSAVRQIIDVIKRPFLAIRDAIKKLVKTVKEVIKKIKEIFLKIKRVVMAIVAVIKAAFQFLGKIINICNKELGTPFERCSRVFESAILDCNAKLGPLFSWLCSITYIVKAVCYLVKPFDLVCMLVDFISGSIIGVVIRKVKAFIRHVKTMFYVRIKFSHSFKFQTNSTKSFAEISEGIIVEIKERTQVLQSLFKFLTSAASLFFLFIIFKVVYYRYKFLTSEKFDNKYITKDFRELDMRRAKIGRETVLPLNNKEAQRYVAINSAKLIKPEKKALSKALSALAAATLKIAIIISTDYCMYWVMNLIRYYGRFQSKMQTPNMPTAFITGKGFLADLLKSIVKAFQPVGINLEIDTVPCLPTPLPPDYDRYVQLAILLLLCWVLTFLEPYGLRLRSVVMSYYHPKRARQRSIWLYNHIMRSRNSFLKFARRQLRRKLFGDKSIEKVTCKEFLAANFKLLGMCLDKPQVACMLCGQVFREEDDKKPIKCHTPGCIGVYCEQCFSDLQNLCTLCLSPIDYGDLSDIDEEKDSSEEERMPAPKKKLKKWKCCKRRKKTKVNLLDATGTSSDETDERDQENVLLLPKLEPADSDYHSSGTTSDLSYSYQYEQKDTKQYSDTKTPFKDIEKQEIPDYASMDSFEELPPAPPPSRVSNLTESEPLLEVNIEDAIRSIPLTPPPSRRESEDLNQIQLTIIPSSKKDQFSSSSSYFEEDSFSKKSAERITPQQGLPPQVIRKESKSVGSNYVSEVATPSKRSTRSSKKANAVQVLPPTLVKRESGSVKRGNYSKDQVVITSKSSTRSAKIAIPEEVPLINSGLVVIPSKRSIRNAKTATSKEVLHPQVIKRESGSVEPRPAANYLKEDQMMTPSSKRSTGSSKKATPKRALPLQLIGKEPESVQLEAVSSYSEENQVVTPASKSSKLEPPGSYLTKDEITKYSKDITTTVSGSTLSEFKKKQNVRFLNAKEPTFCICSDEDSSLLKSDSSLSSVKNILKKPKMFPEIPSKLELCTCSTNVKYEEISETVPSTYSSRNLSSSSSISIPSKEVNKRLKSAKTKLNVLPAKNRRNIEEKHKKRVKEYYKAVNTVPAGEVVHKTPKSKLRNIVKKIIPKKKISVSYPCVIQKKSS